MREGDYSAKQLAHAVHHPMWTQPYERGALSILAIVMKVRPCSQVLVDPGANNPAIHGAFQQMQTASITNSPTQLDALRWPAAAGQSTCSNSPRSKQDCSIRGIDQELPSSLHRAIIPILECCPGRF